MAESERADGRIKIVDVKSDSRARSLECEVYPVAVENGVMITLILVACIGIVSALGGNVSASFSRAANATVER
jgi:hypothetical protein